MELITKYIIFTLLTGEFVVSILTDDGKPASKPESKREELEWIGGFGGTPRRDGKTKRQYDAPRNSLCSFGATGQFPYPPDCKRFINCWKGRGVIQVCSPGTLFNPASRECDYPDKVECAQGEGYGLHPLPSRFPNERPPIRQNARISRRNKEDYKTDSVVLRPYPGRPPYFGPSHLTRPTQRPTAPTAPKLQKVECPPGVAGLFPHPTDCTQFLNCWGGQMFVQRCGPGTFFNPDMSICGYARPGSCDGSEVEVIPEQVKANQEERVTTTTEYPVEDNFFEYGTNILDVRVGVEEEVEEVKEEKSKVYEEKPKVYEEKPKVYEERPKVYEEKPKVYEERPKVYEEKPKVYEERPKVDEVKKNEEPCTEHERDPSWGKILNWGSKTGSRPEGDKVYYDADGNPVRQNHFWTQGGKSKVPNKEQPRPSATDSTTYYLRPHNHVVNHNPPHFQGANSPVHQNPQISRPEFGRRPPYQPSAPPQPFIPGHFILVEDSKPSSPKLGYDNLQGNPEPPTFLVPPREDFSNLGPKDGKFTDLYHAVEEPPRILLPPPMNSDSALFPPPSSGNFDTALFPPQSSANFDTALFPPPSSGNFASANFPLQTNPIYWDYGNWKPYNSKPSATETQAQSLDFNKNFNRKEDHHSKRPLTPEKEIQNPFWNSNPVTSERIPETETVRNRLHQTTQTDRWNNTQEVPTPEREWPVYYGNKNPYGFSTTTVPTTAEPTPASTTGRVFVVYPVKINAEEASFSERTKVEDSKYPVISEKQKDATPNKETLDDNEKWMKPESEISEEDLSVKDVEMYTIDELLPNAGKDIRLKPLSSHLDGYIEMKNQRGEWGLVCDKDFGWMISEANIVCRELGYGRGAQISWQGYPLDSSTESIPVTVTEVKCNGDEESLKNCSIKYSETDCDITKNAVGLRCFDNVTTQCHPEEVEYNNSCYRLVKRDDLDDVGLTLEEAAGFCNKIGGRITDIISQEENDFVSKWLMEKHPEVRSVLTGGIGSVVGGLPLWMWYGSQVPMMYQNWWKGWAEENKIKQGTVHEPSCVVLRKSYPCFVQSEEDQNVVIELGNLEPEYCPANYFYWDVEECNKLNQMKMPYLCKKPLEDIGCIVGRGENYSGTASVTSSGLPCLPWDNPEVKEKLANKITLKEWSSKLDGHNFCRNLGRKELHPWCFVEGKENSEYCSIPHCWDSVPGYSKSVTTKSSCTEIEFECKPGECIQRSLFCDGNKDCSNGRDEAMCRIFLEEFGRFDDKKMKGHGKEQWPGVNENTCAKLCLENKNFKCKSFSYGKAERNCVLSDSNSGLSGEVITGQGWIYYELSQFSVNCSADENLVRCGNGKCVEVPNVCDGKDNCGDGTDERDCERLGYQIRLGASNETNRGRVEVKVLGKWGAVCDDKFNLRAGEVVCRELGFKHGVAEIIPGSHFPPDNLTILVDDLTCLGNETGIRECSFPGWGKHDCKPEETVGVVCRVPETKCPDDQWHCKNSKECIPIRFLCDKVRDCDDGSDEDEKMCNEPVKLRLAGGPNNTAGRLEIRYLGTWGTICDDNFNEAAAAVICRIFGYHGPSYFFKNSYFGPGKGPIWLDGVQCFGNETNVGECDHSDWGKHNCKHDEDISISCTKLNSKQKSAAWRPVAASSDPEPVLSSAAKLKSVLLKECSDNRSTKLESVPMVRLKTARVVGSDIVTGGIPWQGSIRVRSPGGKSSHWCGAVVISPYHVLTAGHCMRDYSKSAYFIRVGDIDSEVLDAEEQELRIDHLYIHPEFNKKLHLNNDIALIKVKGEINLGTRVRPVCMAPSTAIYHAGTNCSISGWGSITHHSTGYARTLRRAYVPILETSLCKAPFVYGDHLGEGMFCAGSLDGGTDSCQGDSGGPITCHHEGKEYLFGITSWGHGCGRANKPGVYTNVAYYSDWIQEKIRLSVM